MKQTLISKIAITLAAAGVTSAAWAVVFAKYGVVSGLEWLFVTILLAAAVICGLEYLRRAPG